MNSKPGTTVKSISISCSCLHCRRFLRARWLRLKLKSRRARIAGGKSRRSGPLSGRLSAGPPMCCAPRNRYGRLAKRISSEGPCGRSYLHWKRRLSQSGGSGARYPGQNTREERRKRQRSMLVRLDPGTELSRTQACGNRRTASSPRPILKWMTGPLYPGDFIHSEAGTLDHRVWSETAVLLSNDLDKRRPFLIFSQVSHRDYWECLLRIFPSGAPARKQHLNFKSSLPDQKFVPFPIHASGPFPDFELTSARRRV